MHRKNAMSCEMLLQGACLCKYGTCSHGLRVSSCSVEAIKLNKSSGNWEMHIYSQDALRIHDKSQENCLFRNCNSFNVDRLQLETFQ